MVSTMDSLEADFFGDMAQDTHGLWEVFEFVRSHHPKLSGQQVFERGCDYIARWIESRWIRVSDSPLAQLKPQPLASNRNHLHQLAAICTRLHQLAAKKIPAKIRHPALSVNANGLLITANNGFGKKSHRGDRQRCVLPYFALFGVILCCSELFFCPATLPIFPNAPFPRATCTGYYR